MTIAGALSSSFPVNMLFFNLWKKLGFFSFSFSESFPFNKIEKKIRNIEDKEGLLTSLILLMSVLIAEAFCK